jgi:hypothetical protein
MDSGGPSAVFLHGVKGIKKGCEWFAGAKCYQWMEAIVIGFSNFFEIVE